MIVVVIICYLELKYYIDVWLFDFSESSDFFFMEVIKHQNINIQSAGYGQNKTYQNKDDNIHKVLDLYNL